ncbi:hypothetical protein KAU33_05670 [Candidatus Dependentiae bacterium]|nr:hypothetical protein [Candidatus Dependentiae bacterium]
MDLKKNNLKIYKIRLASNFSAVILIVLVIITFFIYLFFLKRLDNFQEASIATLILVLLIFMKIIHTVRIPYLIISQNKILLKNIWCKNIAIYKEDIHSIEISKYKLLLNIRNKKSISINLARFLDKDRHEIHESFQRIIKEWQLSGKLR